MTLKHLKNGVIFVSLLFVKFFTLSDGNARFLEPPCRSSVWRFTEYKEYNPPVNYNDNHLDCGGVMLDEDFTSRCGICGDPSTDSLPRPNEDGGKFSRGIIVRTYKIGQEIPVIVQLTYGQNGFMEFSLCAKDDAKSHLDPSCYRNNNPLEIVGPGKKFMVTEAEGKYYNFTLKLPNVTCSRCVLRGRYKTGNNWGDCGVGKPGALGCGPQTVFHGCSDISITP